MNPNYSYIWQLNAVRLRGLFPNEDNFRAVARSELYAVQSRQPQEQQRSADAWEQILDRRHPGWRSRIGKLSESKYVPDEVCFVREGRRVSLDFYKKLNLALEVMRAKPKKIVEVGGGYGQVGRILYALARVEYCVIDLPESLAWSRFFLAKEKVPARLVSAESYESETEQHFDALVNSSSFGEMELSVSRRYLEWFASRVDRSVLLNRLLNTYCPWREAARETEAGWYFYADPDAYVEQWELEPDFTRIDGPETYGHHRELFLVLNHRRSREPLRPLAEFEQANWWRHRSPSPSSRTTNILWPDRDTLRQLLEHVRQYPTAGGVNLLLHYLRAISLRRPFEELPWLWLRFRKLSGQRHCLEPCTRFGAVRKLISWLARRSFSWRYGSLG